MFRESCPHRKQPLLRSLPTASEPGRVFFAWVCYPFQQLRNGIGFTLRTALRPFGCQCIYPGGLRGTGNSETGRNLAALPSSVKLQMREEKGMKSLAHPAVSAFLPGLPQTSLFSSLLAAPRQVENLDDGRQ